MAKSGDGGAGDRPARLRATAGEADLIGHRLRELFGAVEREELPDRLKDLLHRLAEQEKVGERGQ